MPTTVTLSVQDQFSAPLDAYAQKTERATQTTEQLAGEMHQASAASNEQAAKTEQVGLSMSDLYYGIGLAKQGFAALKGAYDETVGSTLTLSDQIRRLSRDIGASAEESSKLIVAADNTGISVDTLTKALDQAIKKGHQPTIANLAKMADAYNAIQNPIDRTKYLMDNFGRAGAEMGALMEKGSVGIRAFGDEAEHTGQIMSGEAVKAAREYEMSMNNLNDSISGMKVQIGEALIPTLTKSTDVITTHFQALNLANQAMASGAINAGDYAKFIAQMAFNYGDATPQVDFFTKKLDEQKQSTDYVDAAVRNYNRDIDNGRTPMADNIGLHQRESDALQVETDKLYALQRAMLDAGSARDVATMQYGKLLQATRDQLQVSADAAQDQLTQIGVSGQLTKNQQAYQDVITRNAPKIAELRAEIAKLNAAQGESVTVVNKGQYSAEQLAVAQERLAIAEQRLIEYHGKSAASLASLQLSVRTAQDAVDNMSAHQATAVTTSGDYSKKIAEDQAALDKLTDANGRAEDAMHKANKEFVFGLVAGDLHGKALLDVALKMGMIDKASYDSAVAINTATEAYKDGTISLGQMESQVKLATDKLNGVEPVADKIPDVLAPAVQAFKDTQQAAYDAAIHGVLVLHDKLDALQDKTITITTKFIEEHYGAGGPGYDPSMGGTTPSTGGTGPGSGGGGGYVNPASTNAASTALARQARNQAMAGAGIMGN